jgi:hypothetical protein
MKVSESSKVWVQVSAYLDGELSAREKESFEQKLHTNDDLRQAVKQMRQTRAMIRSIPHRSAPRNFTLSPSMVAESQPGFRFLVPALSFASAFATLAALVLVVLLTLRGYNPLAGSERLAAEKAQIVAMEQEPTQVVEGPPQIIYWGGPPSVATGMGGGQEIGMGGGAPEGLGGSPAVSQDTSSEPPPSAFLPLATTASKEAAPQLAPTTEAALPEEQPAAPSESTQLAQEPMLGETDQTLDNSTGPILGIRPPQEEGQITIPEAEAAYALQLRAEPARNPWIIVYGLGGLALVSAGAAIFVWRKRRG